MNLKKCLDDPTLQVLLDEIQVDGKLNFVEEPVEILEREFKKLKRSKIAIVKDITIEDVERIRKFLTPNVPDEMKEVIQPLISDEILNVTMVDEEANFSPTKDIEKLERILAKDHQSHITEIQVDRNMTSPKCQASVRVSCSCWENAWISPRSRSNRAGGKNWLIKAVRSSSQVSIGSASGLTSSELEARVYIQSELLDIDFGEPLGWHLEEIHVTWAHLEKKLTRLRLYTKSFEEIVYTERGDGVADFKRRVRIFKMTASGIWRRRQEALLEDLALYDNESWNDPRDFTKHVKAISLPQDVPSTSDHRLIELENQVQCLMEAHLAPKQPVQVNKISSSCEICSGPHDTQYCMENLEEAFIDYASSRTDEAGGKWFTFKPE
ncbi:hypothetical protein Tco_0041082 [Tanacetum coccineum]